MADTLLSTREAHVLTGMSHGHTNAGIGRTLGLSEDAIKTYARRLYQKLGVADRAHAVRRGFEFGLLTPGGAAAAVALDAPAVRPVTRPLTRPRPRGESDKHIALCFAAEACPCRRKENHHGRQT